jgi:hypothetical protein
VHDLTAQFKEFHTTAPALVSGALGAINIQLKGDKLTKTTSDFFNNLRNIYYHEGFPNILKTSGEQAVFIREDINAKLLKKTKEGGELERNVAKQLLSEAREHERTEYKNKTKDLETELSHMNQRQAAITSGGLRSLQAIYGTWIGEVENAFKLGLVTSAQEIQKINKILTDELSALGVKDPGKYAAKIEKNEDFSATGTGGKLVGGVANKAQGGLYQVGGSGESGPDNYEARMFVGGGEQIAVFTKDQQQVANHYLGPVGGLDGLFGTYNKPHWMAAAGGYYPGPQGRTDQGVDFAGPGPVKALEDGVVKRVGLWPGWPGTGGIVYDTARLGLIYIMEDFSPQVKVGEHVKQGRILGQDTGGQFGIETGFANSSGTGPLVTYNGLPDGTPTSGGKLFARLLDGGQVKGVQGLIGSGGSVAAGEPGFTDIHTPKVGLPGPLGKIAQAAVAIATGAANALGHRLAPGGGAGTLLAGASSHGGAPSANERLGRQMLHAAGFPDTEWPYLQKLWTQESGWDANSVNKSSGAYGIPQSLGHGHPYNLGDAGAQIAWGLNYIKGRYHTPRSAWAHEVSSNWYERGGKAKTAAAHRGSSPTHGKGVGAGTPSILSVPKDFQGGGIPIDIIENLLHSLEAEDKAEKTRLHSLSLRETKQKASVSKAQRHSGEVKSEATHDAVQSVINARTSGARSIESAKISLQQAEGHQLGEEPTYAATANKQGNIRGARERLAHAEKVAHDNIRKAENSGAYRSSRRQHSAQVKLEELKAALADTIHGKDIIENKGGDYEATKWRSLKRKVDPELKLAKGDYNKIVGWNADIKRKNNEISNEQTELSNISKKYANSKDPKTRNELLGQWQSILGTRRHKVNELGAKLKAGEAEAHRMGLAFPKLGSRFKELEGELHGEVITSETAEIEGEEQATGGIEGKQGGPSAEQLVESYGKLGTLQQLEAAYAVAESSVVPDQPLTVANEELPGLLRELPIAAQIKGFWESILPAAEQLGQPTTIKDVAGQLTSASSTYYGLKKQIEEAEKGQVAATIGDVTASSNARLELFKNFGSNFAPTYTVPTKTSATSPQAKTVNVNVTNHYKEQPAEPHIWSQGVSWELGAAL